MKKLSLLALSALSILGLVGCGTKSTSGKDTGGNSGEEVQLTAVQKAVKDAMTLSRADLFKKAAAELDATPGAQVKILATTSRGGKSAPKAKFLKLLQEAGCKNADPLKYDSTVDGTIYTTLCGEIENDVQNYTGAILQDGYQLQSKFIDKKYFTNYIPKEWADDAGSDKSAKDPFTLQYNFKTWMANNKNHDTVIDNVWDVTAAKYKGKLDTMDPRNENVNMDWLIMLTSDKECDNLKAAFDDPSNDAKNEIDFSAYAKYGEKRKYAFAFIDKFIENAVFYQDDGKAVNNLNNAPGNIGWIVYSKLENIQETNKISKKNLVIGALGENNTDGSTLQTSSMKGFAGFMYKHYMSIMPNSKYPYATCAFFNVLATTKEGYSAWAKDVGDYPTMPSINIDRSKAGHGVLAPSAEDPNKLDWKQDNSAENVFACKNDPSSDWWIKKGGAIVEDPSYIGTRYNAVASFIQTAMSKKS